MAFSSQNYSVGTGLSPSSNQFTVFVAIRDPNSSDVIGPNGPFKIGQRWVNTAGDSVFDLTSLNTVQGVTTATWYLLANSGGDLNQLTGNTGTALPVAGSIKIAGNNHVVTSAAGSIVTASLDSEVVVSVNGDSGATTANGNRITFHGQGAIVTGVGTPAGNVNILGTDVVTMPTSSGTATVSSNAIQFIGAGTATTSASGNIVTINGTGGGGLQPWQSVSVSQTFAPKINYFVTTSIGSVTYTLPNSPNSGQFIQIVAINTVPSAHTVISAGSEDIAIPGGGLISALQANSPYCSLWLSYSLNISAWVCISVCGQWGPLI